jgi:hypothetical protein|tara:strand:- start:2576 stop:2803 length:228 start_codon:yes stop_codon:yes gene_type:complete
MYPTKTQKKWLERGLVQPGGKLPLFSEDGQQIGKRTVQACIKAGWAKPWKHNPIKPDWLVCRITSEGRKILNNSK